MTLRTAPSAPPARPTRSTRPAHAHVAGDPALDEALDHIGDLAQRLWAVRRLHAPAPRRGLLGRRVRCSGCGQALPCPTLRAADPR